jgi:cytochrome c-type biogenesis protein CcmH
MMIRKLLLIMFLLIPVTGGAVQPDEILDDPALETRARDISKILRCVVCQSENIDDSNAAIARDLRILVRERLVAGDSDDDVISHIVDRYGEYVLFLPPFNLTNAALWLAGPLLLIFGGWLAFGFIRRSGTAPPPTRPLSQEETRRLEQIMDE